ncbi:MAG: hypothetical protein ACOC58_00170 [Chloroflexota bacterium]
MDDAEKWQLTQMIQQLRTEVERIAEVLEPLVGPVLPPKTDREDEK